MKILTVKQPWATLIAEGYKQYEFRSWKTKYRGEIFIHAGKGIDKKYLEKLKDLNLTFPTSRILAKVTITDCIELNEEIGEKIYQKNPLIYGKHHDGYAWKLEQVKKVNIDKEITGKLGLWNSDEEDIKV